MGGPLSLAHCWLDCAEVVSICDRELDSELEKQYTYLEPSVVTSTLNSHWMAAAGRNCCMTVCEDSKEAESTALQFLARNTRNFGGGYNLEWRILAAALEGKRWRRCCELWG